jgi:hypothetical protein
MVVMLIVLVALGTIAGLTVLSVQGGSTQASAQRFSAIALYAAESGAAAAMDWLRPRYSPGNGFTSALREPQPPAGIPGNGVRPGQPGNLLSDDQQGWYEVTLRNNTGDPGHGNVDIDGTIIIEVTGHGPNGAMRRLAWEVHKEDAASPLALVGWRDLF